MGATSQKRFYRFLTVVLGILLLAGPGLTLSRAVFAESGDIGLEIAGEGVTNPLVLTWAELESMKQYEQVFSTINTWPTKRWYMARGIKLRELFALAGVKKEATLFKFVASDNYEMTLTAKELLVDKRFYFPGLKENHPTDGSVPGSTKGKLEVEPILALVSAEDSVDPENLDDRNGLMLIIGQRAVTEQTWLLYVKHLKKIEVLTSAPEKWDDPKVNIPDGMALPAGTQLKLENKNTDSDKIYYTTDGSEPTVDSPMFNWSARRWWEQREDVESINIPLEIVKEMINESRDGRDIVVLKLKTIGPGKEDSEVATYTFYIDPDAEDPTKIPGGPATGIILDRSALDLSIGHTFQLDATVEPFNALDKNVIWSSSDTSVATVDTRGLVTVVGFGTAVITAESADGSIKAACLINGPEGEVVEPDLVIAMEGRDLPEEEERLDESSLKVEKPPVEKRETLPPEQLKRQIEPDLEVTRETEEEVSALATDEQPGMQEGIWRYLAKRDDLAADAIDDDLEPVQSQDSSQMQVFELTLDTAIPLPLPEQQKKLEHCTVAIFLLLFFSGAGNRYREYKKEQ
jgi:hypothetical protein